MGNPFAKPKSPQADPKLKEMQAAEAARVAKEKQVEEDKLAEEAAARLRRLRGQRSLLGGSETGFSGLSDTLG